MYLPYTLFYHYIYQKTQSEKCFIYLSLQDCSFSNCYRLKNVRHKVDMINVCLLLVIIMIHLKLV